MALPAPSPQFSGASQPSDPQSHLPLHPLHTHKHLQFPQLSNSVFLPRLSSSSLRTRAISVTERCEEKESRLTLDSIRDSLIRQEDSIIFSAIERAQYALNLPVYDKNRFPIPGFDGSLVEFMLKETESLHAKVGRYGSPDEHPFYPNDLPKLLLPSLPYSNILHRAADSININASVWSMYFDHLLPAIVKKGDDSNYGSTAVCDVLCLQALSKRIHYGKFVAEAKFQESPELFRSSILAKDGEALMRLITFESVEAKVEKRVENKASTYGQEIEEDENSPKRYKVDPKLVGRLYREWVMPLTKQVQIQYLLHRLD